MPRAGEGVAEGEKTGRLSDQQKMVAQERAIAFRQKVVAIAQGKAHKKGGNAFFPEVFRIASELIEQDTGEFCDRAQEAFEEIEAHGQEPELDDDWVDEITGDNDNFYFSTDSLVQEREKLPGLKRCRKGKAPDEQAVVKAVEEAVQSFEDALAVSHVEQPQMWISTIKTALDKEGGMADFDTLKRMTQLSTGALFLGLLLGQENWEMRQDCFYGQVTVVGRVRKRRRRREGYGKAAF